MDDTSQTPNVNNAEQAKHSAQLHAKSVLTLIASLTVAFRVQISQETTKMYFDRLSKYPLERLKLAITRTLDEWLTPEKMPTIAFVLERIPAPFVDSSKEILGRKDKPADWPQIEAALVERADPSFRVEDARREIAERAAALRELDRLFEFKPVDHIWPKLGNQAGTKCRCPKHRHATDFLFFTCYQRIQEAKL